MLCCWAKIVWYIVLIVYHVFDICLDWYNYHKLFEDKTISGVSISNTTVVAYKYFFCASCVTGFMFSIIMAMLYGYYIYFHWDCLENANYRSLHYSDGEYSIYGDRGSDMKCKRHFVTLELWVSALELLFKDDIQSGILFSLCMSQSIATKPRWYFIAFSVCSVCAHFKLFICFVAKLCGCGSGEESCCKDDSSRVKVYACVFGSIGSAVFFFLTARSL